MSLHQETRSSNRSSIRSNQDAQSEEHEISPIHHDDEYVFLEGKKYLKSELSYAFGGTFNPGVAVRPHLKLGNSTPMGLFAFATTTLIQSLYNAHARGVTNRSAMLGVALFYGGVVQIVAGVWELIMENSFGATVFTGYGGFWMSFAVLTMGGFDIESSYSSPAEFDNALGLFFLAWAVVTLFFTMMTVRSTVAMFILLLTSCVDYMLLAGSNFVMANGNEKVGDHLLVAAGVMGCFVAMAAFYNGLAGLLTRENSWINVHPVFMPGAIHPEELKAKEA